MSLPSKAIGILLMLFAALWLTQERATEGDPLPSPVTPSASSRTSSPETDRDAPVGLWSESACRLPPHHVKLIARGLYGSRSPDISVVPRAPNFFGSFEYTTHSGPWSYLQEVPFVFYGPGFVESRGTIKSEDSVTSADLAPSVARLINVRFPHDRAGSPLNEALKGRKRIPRLVVTIVWDGGGTNVLEQWPQAWPHLESLMARGTSFENGIVGSSPSVTPAVHATIGTGAWPSRHGIVDIPLRIGSKTVGSWPNRSPRFLEMTTLADMYDLATLNRAKVAMVGDHNWHLGMIGHGAGISGADRDIAVMFDRARPITNPKFYKLPRQLKYLGGFEKDIEAIDDDDGALDGAWLGNSVLGDRGDARRTPAGVLFNTRLIKELIATERMGADEIPDLLYVNYKQIDWAGHDYNMLEPEVGEMVEYTDRALGDLVDFLDRKVGKRKWVLILTADHGSTPFAESSGAWPIFIAPLKESVAAHFGVQEADLFLDERVTGLWLDASVLEQENIREGQVATFMSQLRIRDNIPDGLDVPQQYQDRMDERIFSAAFPSSRIEEVMRCVQDS